MTLPALALGGIVLVAIVGAVVLGSTELGQQDGESTTLAFNGRTVVPRGQVQDDVYVGRGRAVVLGRVEDDVVVLSGVARIEGSVGGDVVVVQGGAILGEDAVVGGRVRTSDTPVDDGAEVRGGIERIGLLDLPGLVPGSAWWALWAASGLAALALLLGLGGRAREVAATGLSRPGRNLGLGAAVAIGGPVVVGLLAVGVLGAGLAMLLAAALVGLGAAGAAVTAATVGRLLDGRAPSELGGWLLTGVALAIGLVLSPLLAGALAVLVMTYGAGALVGVALDRRGEGNTQVSDPDDPVEVPVVEHHDEPRVLVALPILGNGLN